MSYTKSEHQNAITKLVREKRIILQADAACVMNKDNINSTVKLLVKEGKIKRQKVKVRGSVGNLIDMWLLYSIDVKQAEILDYEKILINRPYNSPLVKNHCYKKIEAPIEQEIKSIPQNWGESNSKILENDNNTTELTIIDNSIIPIYDNNNERIVNARELHGFLQVKDKFATWITRRIEKYGFIENEDFIHISQKCETSTGATIRKDYYLKMDTAKEISMVENNERGRHIRKYFIDIEKQFKQQNTKQPTNSIEALKLIVAELESHENRISQIENKLKLLAE
jgi:phage anti-repressor protein